MISALKDHAKRVSALSGGRAEIAGEAREVLEKKDALPEDFREKMAEAAKNFSIQYKANRGMDISSLLPF